TVISRRRTDRRQEAEPSRRSARWRLLYLTLHYSQEPEAAIRITLRLDRNHTLNVAPPRLVAVYGSRVVDELRHSQLWILNGASIDNAHFLFGPGCSFRAQHSCPKGED